jgi:hypothetical protein
MLGALPRPALARVIAAREVSRAAMTTGKEAGHMTIRSYRLMDWGT